MLLIVAEGDDDLLELSARRDRFTCEDFSYLIAHDGKSGFVVLLPQGRPPKVSRPSVGYVSIRVMDSARKPVGSMHCSGNGRVSGSTAAMP
jgi:hypothetical protein